MGLMPIYQKPNTSRPTKGHKTYPYLARAACVRTGQIRSGVWTSPICRCVAALGMASDRWRLMPRSPWWRSWTGTRAWSWRGGSPTSSHGPPLVRGPWRGDANFCVEALNEAIYRFGPPDIMTMQLGRAIGPSGHATSRVPVHVVCLDRPPAPVRDPYLDGRQGSLPGQHPHRTAVADAEPQVRAAKYECIYLHAWETGSQARTGVRNWMEFYNHRRPHKALGGRPPAVVCSLTGEATHPDQQEQIGA